MRERLWLRAVFVVALALWAGLKSAPAQTSAAISALQPEHRLRLFNTHTNERIDIVFRHGESYLPDAIAKLDYFLRDHRTGDVRHYDPRLYDILEDLTATVGHPGGEIDIICGYRSPWTNEFLREHTKGVAKNSLHIQAEAIDLRMPGVNTLQLRAAALSLHRGGVGYYPHSDFIHVDTGRVRQWCFDCPAKLLAGD
ncbi:MAG TPA: DUF882 domain-containing protein [Candidatus Limnocylindrales bacterium]|nr:DUF882 domain-containing protein [Candidatus Limnocylindrales bacterium]